MRCVVEGLVVCLSWLVVRRARRARWNAYILGWIGRDRRVDGRDGRDGEAHGAGRSDGRGTRTASSGLEPGRAHPRPGWGPLARRSDTAQRAPPPLVLPSTMTSSMTSSPAPAQSASFPPFHPPVLPIDPSVFCPRPTAASRRVLRPVSDADAKIRARGGIMARLPPLDPARLREPPTFWALRYRCTSLGSERRDQQCHPQGRPVWASPVPKPNSQRSAHLTPSANQSDTSLVRSFPSRPTHARKYSTGPQGWKRAPPRGNQDRSQPAPGRPRVHFRPQNSTFRDDHDCSTAGEKNTDASMMRVRSIESGSLASVVRGRAA